jgi:hypothetical protein
VSKVSRERDDYHQACQGYTERMEVMDLESI